MNPESETRPTPAPPPEPDPQTGPEDPFLRVRVRTLILWVPGIAIASGLVAMLVGYLLYGDLWTTDDVMPVLFYGFDLGLILWVLRQNTRAGIDFERLIGRPPPDFPYSRLVKLALALVVFSVAVMALFGSLLTLLDVVPPWVEAESADAAFEGLPLLHRLSMMILLAPVLEEIVFRGYFLHRFAAKWNLRAAIWVSSILFAFCHWDVIGALVLALVGCCLYLRTRSLLIPMLVHGLNNVIACFGLLLQALLAALGQVSETGDVPVTGGSEVPSLEPGAFICLGVLITILLVATVPYLVRFLRDNWPERDMKLPYEADPQDGEAEVYWRNHRRPGTARRRH